MRIEEDIKLDFKDVLIRPKRSTLQSRKQVSVKRKYTFYHSGQEFNGVPIIAANMDTVGTFNVAAVLQKYHLMTALHKYYSIEELKKFFTNKEESDGLSVKESCFYTMGVNQEDKEKLNSLVKLCENDLGKDSFKNGEIVKSICIDVANGYSERFVDFISEMRDRFPKVTLMAGNVVTGEMVEQLILAGADIVKVGIGPGSVCTTRAVTGVGYPQLSATIECADAAHGLGGHVCADGGCQVPGDIVKAFGAGADMVMIGGMLSGHKECGGEFVEKKLPNGETKKVMQFYGMSSTDAMDKHSGGVADYRASEGKCVEVPYKGNVEDTIKDILGGVRSACTYVGATTLKELPKRTTFIRVTQQLNPMFS